MAPLPRHGRFAAVGIAVLALSLTGCATMRVSSFVDRGTDFTRYRTFNWDPAGLQATGDPRLDNNPFFQDRVRADVDKLLAARGFEKVTSGTPDVLIHIHILFLRDEVTQSFGPITFETVDLAVA